MSLEKGKKRVAHEVQRICSQTLTEDKNNSEQEGFDSYEFESSHSPEYLLEPSVGVTMEEQEQSINFIHNEDSLWDK